MVANPWAPSSRHREPAELMKPVRDAAAWYPHEISGTDAWVYRLSEREIDEIHAAVARVEERNLGLMDVGPHEFPLPGLAAALADIRSEILDGRGLALIRGLPVEGRSRVQIAIAFWGLGHHMGRAKSQNGRGHLLGHVVNIAGEKPIGEKVRGYMSGSALAFHTDRTDILSLCCLHPAKSGGAHRVSSSVMAYNEILKTRPDLVKELMWDFYRTRNGEIPVGETEPWMRQPVFSVKDGYFTARSPGSKVWQAQDLPGVPKLSPIQIEALETFQHLAEQLSLDVELQAGDITYVNCHVTLHARNKYEDWPEPERKRHLLRLWLNTGGQRPLVESVAREVDAGVVVDGAAFQTPLEPV